LKKKKNNCYTNQAIDQTGKVILYEKDFIAVCFFFRRKLANIECF
jgi:hypothetical protein